MNLFRLSLSHLSDIFGALIHRRGKHNRQQNTEPPVLNGHSETQGAVREKEIVPSPQRMDQTAVRELQQELQEERAVSDKRRADYEAAMAENHELQARLIQLEQSSELRGIEELPEQVEQQKATTDGELAAVETQQLKTRLAQLEDEAKRGSAKVADLERAYAQAEKERRSTSALLQTRTAELREAQMFLTKVDDVEDSEVVHVVDSLNAQIANVAARLADVPQFRAGRQKDASIADRAIRRLERYSWVGPQMLSALRSSERPYDPVLVRIALQAGMVMYARWLATSWDLGVFDSRGLLEGIYLSLREREPQSVAGRWRILCRTHVKALLETGEAQTKRLFETLSVIVTDVLVVCGAVGTWDSVSEIVVHEFETALYEIVNLALQFQWTVGERVVSCDFVAFVVDSDAVFDAARTRSSMLLGWRTRRPGPRKLVSLSMLLRTAYFAPPSLG